MDGGCGRDVGMVKALERGECEGAKRLGLWLKSLVQLWHDMRFKKWSHVRNWYTGLGLF